MANDHEWKVVQLKGGKAQSSKQVKNQISSKKLSSGDVANSKIKSVVQDVQTKKNNTKKKPNSVKSNKKKTMKSDLKPLQEVLKKEELIDFDKKITEIKNEFATNDLLYLKEVASYLNLHLTCSEEVTTETAKLEKFPLCRVNKSLVSILEKTFQKNLNEEFASILFNYCIDKMLECISKGEPVLGFQLCIQVLADNKFQLNSTDKEIVEKILTFQSNPKKCFAYAWAITRTGSKSRNASTQVWLRFLLPTLHIKSLSAFSMDYIETLLKKNSAEIGIQPEQFCLICRCVFNNDEKHKKLSTIRKRITDLFPTFKSAILKSQLSRHNYFNYFISTNNVEDSVEMTETLLKLAVTCMKSDKHCFTLWKNHYSSNMPKTRMLLEFIDKNPEERSALITCQVFCQTIKSFNNKNEDLVEKNDPTASKSDFHQIKKLCKSYNIEQEQLATSSTTSLVWAFYVLVVAILAGLVAYDVHENQAAFCQHFKSKVYQIVDIVYGFYMENVDLYVKKAYKELKPYLMKALDAFECGMKKLISLCTPYIRDSYPYVKKYFAIPLAQYCKLLVQYTLELTDKVVDLYEMLFAYFLNLLSDISKDQFQFDEFKKNLSVFASNAYSQLSDYYLLVVDKITGYLASIKV